MNNDYPALMRCSIYARVSSALQSENSVPDQIAECRRFIASRGWKVAEEHIYIDEFVSGACISRPGYDKLKKDAAERQFDLVVVHDLSRLGRDHLELLTTQKELHTLGIGILGASDGVETAAPSGEFLFQIRSAVAELFLKDLAVKVKRGLRGQVERSYSAGGRTFGYTNVVVPHPDGGNSRTGLPRRLGVKVEIDEAQAAVVRQIFELRAKGMGLKAVCRKLTRDGIPSPRYQLRGKGDPTWSVGTVLGILGNRKYRGEWSWGRCHWSKDRVTGKRKKKLRPESEWLSCQREDLRIVSDDV